MCYIFSALNQICSVTLQISDLSRWHFLKEFRLYVGEGGKKKLADPCSRLKAGIFFYPSFKSIHPKKHGADGVGGDRKKFGNIYWVKKYIMHRSLVVLCTRGQGKNVTPIFFFYEKTGISVLKIAGIGN